MYLHTGTRELEIALKLPSKSLTGPVVTSSQGMSNASLRQPTNATVDRVLTVLTHGKKIDRYPAACLLALYLESVSGRQNDDLPSMELRAYIHSKSLNQLPALLQDPAPSLRHAGALLAGNLFFCGQVDQMLKDAFDLETDPQTKIYLAWAYYHLTN